MTRAPWLLLQLADAAFPAGGFAHSAGLEAALHHGALGAAGELEAFVEQVILQAGRASLPFVCAACAEPARLASLDAALDAMLLSHVANRASRAQGRAFASAATRIFEPAPGSALASIAEHAQRGPAHHAAIFGAVFGALGEAPRDAAVAFLHGAARGVLSAAVRLGAVGPLEAQRLQAERAPLLERVAASSTTLDVADAAQPSPLVELYGSLHDRLDGHLFQS
jgi:urease accessory protein